MIVVPTMASYRVLLSGLLLAVALVNCHALPADIDLDASAAISTTSGTDASAAISTTSGTESEVDEAKVAEEVAEGVDEASVAETYEFDISGDAAGAVEQQDSTDDESEELSVAEEVANVGDGEINASETTTTNNEESATTDSATVATGSDVARNYSVSTTRDGQYNVLNVTGPEINASIRVSGVLPIKTYITEKELVVSHILFSDSGDKLVVLEDGNCVERTYSAGTVVSERNMTSAECHQVIGNMHRVQRQAEEVAREIARMSGDANQPMPPGPFGDRPFRPQPRRGGHRHRRHGNRLARLFASPPAPNAQQQSAV